MSSSNIRIKYSSSTTSSRGVDELDVIAVSRPSTRTRATGSTGRSRGPTGSLAHYQPDMLIGRRKGVKRVQIVARPAGRRSHGIPPHTPPRGIADQAVL